MSTFIGIAILSLWAWIMYEIYTAPEIVEIDPNNENDNLF